tara:strand:+ start:2527 stop:3648 length:1122 start_codon:yes stop_codon:yes gene_type:complete
MAWPIARYQKNIQQAQMREYVHREWDRFVHLMSNDDMPVDEFKKYDGRIPEAGKMEIVNMLIDYNNTLVSNPMDPLSSEDVPHYLKDALPKIIEKLELITQLQFLEHPEVIVVSREDLQSTIRELENPILEKLGGVSLSPHDMLVIPGARALVIASESVYSVVNQDDMTLMGSHWVLPAHPEEQHTTPYSKRLFEKGLAEELWHVLYRQHRNEWGLEEYATSCRALGNHWNSVRINNEALAHMYIHDLSEKFFPQWGGAAVHAAYREFMTSIAPDAQNMKQAYLAFREFQNLDPQFLVQCDEARIYPKADQNIHSIAFMFYRQYGVDKIPNETPGLIYDKRVDRTLKERISTRTSKKNVRRKGKPKRKKRKKY